MEGASARHKTGRCGQKVNCPRGGRGRPWGGGLYAKGTPVSTYHGVGATLVVARGGHKGRPYRVAEAQADGLGGKLRQRGKKGCPGGGGPYAGEPSASGDEPRPYVPAPSLGFLPYRPVRRGRYGVSPRRRKATGRTTWGDSKDGARRPLFGRFGDRCREGGNRNPLPGRLFRPFLAVQKGRRRHNKKAVVKKGNMEGASARHKTGRCGQKVIALEGKRGRPTQLAAQVLHGLAFDAGDLGDSQHLGGPILGHTPK